MKSLLTSISMKFFKTKEKAEQSGCGNSVVKKLKKLTNIQKEQTFEGDEEPGSKIAHMRTH